MPFNDCDVNKHRCGGSHGLFKGLNENFPGFSTFSIRFGNNSVQKMPTKLSDWVSRKPYFTYECIWIFYPHYTNVLSDLHGTLHKTAAQKAVSHLYVSGKSAHISYRRQRNYKCNVKPCALFDSRERLANVLVLRHGDTTTCSLPLICYVLLQVCVCVCVCYVKVYYENT